MSKAIWASLAITVMLLNACVAPETPQVPPVNDAAAPTAATPSQPAGAALLPPETPPPGAEREFSTDFSRHTVSYDEVFSGGPPKDGIPAIDAPQFVSIAVADGWLAAQEPVVLVQVGDDARAYPLQILTWHEIVNDTVGGLPLTVTFCPLCNTAIAFERTLDGRLLTFVNERDRIVDAETGSVRNLLGQAVDGELAGQQLAPVVGVNHFWFSWAAFKPETRIYQP
jgi:hypothetical protein